MTDTISVGECPACHGPAQFLVTGVREVRLPNIDEDLGGGWHLTGIDRMLQVLRLDRTWRAGAQSRTARLPDVYGWGETPSAAYLALRTAIEARP